jgi:hypothetical protein
MSMKNVDWVMFLRALMIYGNENVLRFMMSKGFHEMFIDLWKWYVVERMSMIMHKEIKEPKLPL